MPATPEDQPFQLDEALFRRVADLARATASIPESMVRLVLQCLQRVSSDGNGPSQQDDRSPHERAVAAGLLSCVHDAPADLSTNPSHMEGFGSD